MESLPIIPIKAFQRRWIWALGTASPIVMVMSKAYHLPAWRVNSELEESPQYNLENQDLTG